MRKFHLTKVLIIAIILFSSFYTNLENLYAQSYQVTGKIVDKETKKPLMRATVTIHNAKDSSQATGGYTDKDGNFKLSVSKSGNYYLRCNYVSYDTYYKNFTVTNENINLKTISLTLKTVKTKAVQILADKEAVQVGLDRKVFKINQEAENLGSTATDVLENIPSVSVDQDGTVSMRGSSDLTILIDGRPSNLSGSDALDQIPASMIESIELITNPGSKFEAEGTAGMINIVTVREKMQGVSGMVNLSAGTDDVGNMKYNASANGSYNVGKFRINANLSGRFNKGQGVSKEYSEYYYGLDTTFLTKNGMNTSKRDFMSGKINIDYYLTKQNIFSYSFNVNNRKRYSDAFNEFLYSNDNSNTRRELNDPNMINMENSLTYKHLFEQKGHELTLDAFYSQFDNDQHKDYKQLNYKNNILSSTDIEQTEQDVDTKLFTAQVDYALPIGITSKFEAGAKLTHRDNHNSIIYEILDNDIFIRNDRKSDIYNYLESVYAIYTTFGSKLGALKYQLGVRSETTVSDFNSELKLNNEFSKNYTGLYPSIYLSYELTPNHSFNANLAKRLRRPRYHDLNPIIDYEDPLNLRSGNSELNPESLYLAELGYMLNYDYTTITATAFYRYVDDMIQMYKTVYSGDTMITRPYNIASSKNLGLEMILMQRITDWWKIDWSGSYFTTNLDANNLTNGNRTSGNMWNTRIKSSMNWNKKYELQISANYNSAHVHAQGKFDPSWSSDMSFKYNFLGDKASLSFRIRDIFNTRKWQGYTYIEDSFYSEYEHSHYSRQFTLGFSYKINNYNQRERRGHNEDMGDDDSSDF